MNMRFWLVITLLAAFTLSCGGGSSDDDNGDNSGINTPNDQLPNISGLNGITIPQPFIPAVAVPLPRMVFFGLLSARRR